MISVDIVFPVYYKNYSEIKPSLEKTAQFCSNHLKNYDWKLVLAINGLNPEKLIDLTEFDKKLERTISINFYLSFKEIHKNLKENIFNGIVLVGGVEL